MILSCFLAAVGQIFDPRFLRVTLFGVALALLLLAGVYAGFVMLVDATIPDGLTLPRLGTVHGVHQIVGWGSLLLMLVLSVFLMVPVASAFSGLFLEDVAAAVEARHYPALPPVAMVGFWDGIVGSINFFGVIVAVNIVALLAWPFAGPLIPLLFWGMNGYLLGREYFEMAAARRIGRDGARALRRANKGTVWLAGVLMAAPLSLPVINLFVPVLGAATFTHLFHRLVAKGQPTMPPPLPVGRGGRY